MTPVLSIAIPVFNRREMVAGAINSALNQNIEGLEVVVVDNCSTDGTWELLQGLKDPRLKVFQNSENIGLFGNFSRCVELAAGEFCAILCSDDRICPGFLKHALELLRATPSAVMISGSGRLVDQNGKTIRYINREIKPGLYLGSSAKRAFFWYSGAYSVNIFNYPSGMVLRRDILVKELPFRADLGDPGDVDMWLRCLKYGNFLVTNRQACDVTWHQSQGSCESRKTGVHVPDLLRFAGLYIGGKEDQGELRKLRMLLGGSAAAWAFRKAIRGHIGTALSARRFGPNLADLALGTAIRVSLRLLAKLGVMVGCRLQPALPTRPTLRGGNN